MIRFYSRCFSIMTILSIALSSTFGQVATFYNWELANGTYTSITGGTVLGNTSSNDQRFLDPATPLGGTTTTGVGLPIGFNFTFNGTSYDRFGIHYNGWITFGQSTLGATAVNMASASAITPLTSTTAITPTHLRNRICGFAGDLAAQTGSELRFETLGTAPNRVMVVQWTNARHTTASGDSYNFQIRLFESTNNIEIHFGSFTQNGTNRTRQIGLGGSVATDYNARRVVNGTQTYLTSIAATANSQNCAITSTLTPPSGTIYRWVFEPCPLPTGLAMTNVTGVSTTFNWVAGPTSTAYEVEYKTASSGTWTSHPSNPIASTSVVITGLNTNIETYNFRVRSVCAGPTTSGIWANYCMAPGDALANALPVASANNPGATTGSLVGPCLNNDYAGRAGIDIFHRFTAVGCSRTATIDFCGGASWDTYMFVLDSAGQTVLGQNDDFCGAQSSVTINVVPSMSYVVVLKPFSTTTVTGNYTLNISYTYQTDISNATAATVNPTCVNSTSGSVTLTPVGGAVPYTVLWDDNVSTGLTRTGMTARRYSYRITDTCGGDFFGFVELTQGSSLLANAHANNNVGICSGASTTLGAAPTASLGNPGYTYEWSPATGLNNATIANPTANPTTSTTYYVTVTDICNNTAVDSVRVEVGAALLASASALDISCSGGSDGEAMADMAVGGTTPLTYLWSNGATTSSINGLSAGVYQLTISDGCGLTSMTSTTVTEPTALAPTVVLLSDATCQGLNDGSIDIDVAGGTSPYGYSWSNGAISQDIAGLFGGSYNVTITDANGCTASLNGGTISAPSSLSLNVDAVSSASCFGANDGEINLTFNGGTAPISFLWNNGATTEDLSNLTPGQYVARATDANGCFLVSQIFNVGQATALTASVSTTNVYGTSSGNNGTAMTTPTGGTGPYIYSWSNGATTPNISGLSSGFYSVTVIDNNGCQTTAFGNVLIFTEVETTGNLSNLVVYPNPSEHTAFIKLSFNTQVENMSVKVLNSLGQMVESKLTNDFNEGQIELNVADLPAGLYIIHIEADGQYHTAKLMVRH